MNRTELEQALHAAESRLVDGDQRLDLQAERARLLAALGRTDEAKARYLEILGRDPTHFETLNNFGVLLHETGFRTAARTLFNQAVLLHPDRALGHVNLGNLLMYEDQLVAAREHFEIALRLEPDNLAAHQRLSALLHDLGDAEGMRRHRRAGFAPRPTESFPYLGDGRPIGLLVLTSTPAADLAWPMLIDPKAFAVTSLVVEFCDLGALPPHDLIFNAIGDADLAQADLTFAEAVVAASGRPVINDPARVKVTGRLANAIRLGEVPGVIAPKMLRLEKSALGSANVTQMLATTGLAFPVLIRSPGFHTGRHFVRVESEAELAAAVEGLPGQDVLAIETLDARGRDGFFRKYRVMMIDGALFPLHLAISTDWKTHYATSAMADNACFQAEEALFLETMPAVLGASACEALRAIQSTLGLDYAGIDFALNPAGEVLLFEANAVMKIVPPDASPQWDYRRPAVGRALAAARRMIQERGARALAARGLAR